MLTQVKLFLTLTFQFSTSLELVEWSAEDRSKIDQPRSQGLSRERGCAPSARIRFQRDSVNSFTISCIDNAACLKHSRLQVELILKAHGSLYGRTGMVKRTSWRRWRHGTERIHRWFKAFLKRWVFAVRAMKVIQKNYNRCGRKAFWKRRNYGTLKRKRVHLDGAREKPLVPSLGKRLLNNSRALISSISDPDSGIVVYELQISAWSCGLVCAC